MSEKETSIIDKYSREIQEIAHKLNDLEKSRIYEVTKNRSDGYLATNAKDLKKMISELLFKIDNKSPSVNDRLSEIFKKYSV